MKRNLHCARVNNKLSIFVLFSAFGQHGKQDERNLCRGTCVNINYNSTLWFYYNLHVYMEVLGFFCKLSVAFAGHYTQTVGRKNVCKSSLLCTTLYFY